MLPEIYKRILIITEQLICIKLIFFLFRDFHWYPSFRKTDDTMELS